MQGRFEKNCNSLAHTVEVNIANEKLIRKFKNIKKSKSIGYHIMDRVIQVYNPAVNVLKESSWFIHKIKNVFGQ
jgi:predicted transcriptional regulator